MNRQDAEIQKAECAGGKENERMKVLIVGGVAAGTKVAAKLMREDRSCEVTILTKGKGYLLRGLRSSLLCWRSDSGERAADCQHSGIFFKADRSAGTDRDGGNCGGYRGKDGYGGT